MMTEAQMKAQLQPDEATLFELMKDYRVTTDNLEDACEQLDAEVQRLQYARKIIAEPYEKRLEELELRMRLPMLDRQASFVCSFGKIAFREGAVRRTYNAESLDMLCNARPDIKEAIWPFRSESVGESSISVELTETEVK